jgi:flagellar biosynthesis protein
VPATTTPHKSSANKRNTAVALKAAPDRDVSAPARIVAKGDGALADQILELAFATGVKVREDANLVEVLDAIDVDCEVPLHALAAVAEILTYVYRANGDIAAPEHTHHPEPEG